ncbi:hypothetical protein MASR2M15_18960 [Anaerolineales bacterium]
MKQKLILLILLFLVPISALQAQQVSDDDVNDVAKMMYCPVCENIPLNDCGTATCVAWKEEIRELLAAGEAPQEIVNAFVSRYGQHVVGVPQDPILQVLSFVFPIVGILIALLIALWTFRKWSSRKEVTVVQSVTSEDHESEEAYRQRIESDLK